MNIYSIQEIIYLSVLSVIFLLFAIYTIWAMKKTNFWKGTQYVSQFELFKQNMKLNVIQKISDNNHLIVQNDTNEKLLAFLKPFHLRDDADNVESNYDILFFLFHILILENEANGYYQIKKIYKTEHKYKHNNFLQKYFPNMSKQLQAKLSGAVGNVNIYNALPNRSNDKADFVLNNYLQHESAFGNIYGEKFNSNNLFKLREIFNLREILNRHKFKFITKYHNLSVDAKLFFYCLEFINGRKMDQAV